MQHDRTQRKRNTPLCGAEALVYPSPRHDRRLGTYHCPISYFPFLGVDLGPETTLAFDPRTDVIVFLVTSWVFLMWMKLFGVWTDFYLDEWHVTNARVIDIDQIGFFKREISTFPIERIQDITVKYTGPISNLLNFGNIHVQTAGASRDQFVIRGIADPQSLRQLILKCYDLYQEKYVRSKSEGLS